MFERKLQLHFVVTATTRPKRANERPPVDEGDLGLGLEGVAREEDAGAPRPSVVLLEEPRGRQVAVENEDARRRVPIVELEREVRRRDEVVQMLLKRGASVNARNRSQGTPLHWAAKNGDARTALMLIAHGAQLDAVNSTGMTALMLPFILTHRQSYIFHYLGAYGLGLGLLASRVVAIEKRWSLVALGFLVCAAGVSMLYLPLWTGAVQSTHGFLMRPSSRKK